MIGDTCEIRPTSYKCPHSSARVMDIVAANGVAVTVHPDIIDYCHSLHEFLFTVDASRTTSRPLPQHPGRYLFISVRIN
ncbi:hypothetical protein KIN20_007834 [Parelaphostrongylus tenuis]|uniref:Uncharacterized protein n=1 Tax=Parelaphostrongylus tenuis TaxID=148309 RepID=A0AAD5QJF0_PARTN|nr:hypothetical protein KIN20_007834 [Parelaphostrongylus tenuis]